VSTFHKKPGELNPTTKASTKTFVDPQHTTFFGLAKQQSIDATRENVFEGMTRFKAVVLYAWKETPSEEANASTHMGGLGEYETVYVKAAIPEIDKMPFPSKLPIANNSQADADWTMINQYKTYAAMDTSISNLGVPAPGTIVYVTFEQISADHIAGGIYMGPVNIDDMPNPEGLLETPDVKWTQGTTTLQNFDLDLGDMDLPEVITSPEQDIARALWVQHQTKLIFPGTIGFPARMLFSIQACESGGNPNVIRFEPHVFYGYTKSGPNSYQKANRTRNGNKIPYPMPVPYQGGGNVAGFQQKGYGWAVRRGKLKQTRVSFRGEETNSAAFQRAFAQDPVGALFSTSFGAYQFLGMFLLAGANPEVRGSIYNHSTWTAEHAQKALALYKENPIKASDYGVVAIIKAKGRDFVQRAASAAYVPGALPDFAYVARRFNGDTSAYSNFKQDKSKPYSSKRKKCPDLREYAGQNLKNFRNTCGGYAGKLFYNWLKYRELEGLYEKQLAAQLVSSTYPDLV
tara:strand:+ start:1661 stop:3208 length:1548 start_codon:yes stop_codon:yes gene_type:complete